MFGRNRSKNETKPLERYVRDVEGILQKVGVNLDEAKMALEEGYGWEFRRGSASIEVYIVQRDDRTYLQVLSPLMYLPQSNLLPLYRRMLEYNLQMTSASLGIFNDIVYVFSERPVIGLDADETDDIIDFVSAYADDLDNTLVNEFGGRLYLQV